jgi:hypothetical protein
MRGQGRFANWSLGVTDVGQISRIDGTEDEGRVLPRWCDEHHLQSIVVVATEDHSRRLRRMLDRVMKGHPTHVTVRAARYSSFDPDRWWETPGGVRTEIIELQKLLLDVMLHPMQNHVAFGLSRFPVGPQRVVADERGGRLGDVGAIAA